MKGIKMKRYKLLKDTPIAPKGEIFQEYKKNGDTFLYWLDKNGAEYSTEFRKATIFNFDEWFKEVNDFKVYTPIDGETYKFLNIYEEISTLGYLEGSQSGKFRLSTGNCYSPDTPDELIIKEQKLIPQALHRLKMAAKKAWFEFNGSDGPDWSDCGQYKHYVYYNWSVSNKGFYVVDTDSANVFGCIYFPTKESAQWAIDNMRDDLKLVMGIE